MSRQTGRTAARRAAMDAMAQRQSQRLEREKRIDKVALEVVLALAERDAAVEETEARAGRGLGRLLEEEGLALREAVERCGDPLTEKEAQRLRRQAQERPEADHTAAPAGPATSQDVTAGAGHDAVPPADGAPAAAEGVPAPPTDVRQLADVP